MRSKLDEPGLFLLNGFFNCPDLKPRNNGDNTEDTTVNAGFSGSKSGQRKKALKINNPGSSSLDRILDRSCQIHGTPDKPANHTNRDCWVFKQAGKINAENKDKGLHRDDDEEPRRPNTGEEISFVPQCSDVGAPHHHRCVAPCPCFRHLFCRPV